MDHNSRDGDLSSTRKLLTNAWTKRVDTAEIEIRRFKLKRPLTNDCKVVFFEIADDASLRQCHASISDQGDQRLGRAGDHARGIRPQPQVRPPGPGADDPLHPRHLRRSDLTRA